MSPEGMNMSSSKREPRVLRVEVKQLPNGYWRGIVHALIPGYPGRLEREANAFHTAREAFDWAWEQYALIIDWAEKATENARV